MRRENAPCGPSLEGETDVRLFVRFRESGDRAAVEALARRWHTRAYRVARAVCLDSQLAMDAVQGAFLLLLSPRVPFQVHSAERFRSWFLTVVTNRARMTLRAEARAARKARVDPASFARRKGHHEQGPEAFTHTDKREALMAALGRLEKRWREPVVLHFISGLRQKEIAAMFGVSQQVISRRIACGLRLLRDGLQSAA
jgi:RNA polymerase sigma-70 factor (ECF subfamily)